MKGNYTEFCGYSGSTKCFARIEDKFYEVPGELYREIGAKINSRFKPIQVEYFIEADGLTLSGISKSFDSEFVYI
jgi:hypothetical protein